MRGPRGTRAIPFVILFVIAARAALLRPDTRTFSVTHKPGQGIHPGVPLTLCNHTASGADAGQHAVLMSWFTGSIPWLGFGDTTISYYVDDEEMPSVCATVNMLTGGAFANETGLLSRKLVPWGNAALGRTARGGGAYTTMKVPFSRSIRVVATMADGETQSRSFYSLIRGLEGYGPVTLSTSGLQLPPSARLRSFYVRRTNLAPTAWAVLANISTACGPGALLFVSQHVISDNAFCLEGTHLAILGDIHGPGTTNLELVRTDSPARQSLQGNL